MHNHTLAYTIIYTLYAIVHTVALCFLRKTSHNWEISPATPQSVPVKITAPVCMHLFVYRTYLYKIMGTYIILFVYCLAEKYIEHKCNRMCKYSFVIYTHVLKFNYSIVTGQKQKRCGSCQGCLAKDCKTFKFCQDKKYGGPGKLE